MHNLIDKIRLRIHWIEKEDAIKHILADMVWPR